MTADFVQFRVFSLDYARENFDYSSQPYYTGWHVALLPIHYQRIQRLTHSQTPPPPEEDYVVPRAAVFTWAQETGIKTLRHRVNMRAVWGEGITHFWLPLKDFAMLKLEMHDRYHIDRRNPERVNLPGTADVIEPRTTSPILVIGTR